MAGREYPLKLKLTADDSAAGAVLNRFNAKLTALSAPARVFAARWAAVSKAAGVPRLVTAFEGVGKSIGKVEAAAKTLTIRVAAIATGAGAGLFEFVRSSAEAGNQLAKLSSRLGLTVDELGAYQFAGEMAGGATDSLNAGLDTFNANLGQARTGTGRMFALLLRGAPLFLNQLRLTKSNGQALDLVFKKLQHLQPNERAAFARAAFGEAGPDVVDMVAQGKSLADVREQYLRLRGSQEGFVKAATPVSQALVRMKWAFLGTKDAVAEQLFPVFRKFFDLAAGWLVTNREAVRAWATRVATSITNFLDRLPAALSTLQQRLQQIKNLLQPIADKLGGWVPVFAIVAAAIIGGPLLSALASLTASFVTLGIAIGLTPLGWISAGIVLLAGAALLLHTRWSPVLTWFVQTWDGIKETISGVANVILGLATMDFKRIARGLGDAAVGFVRTGTRGFEAVHAAALKSADLGTWIGSSIRGNVLSAAARAPTLPAPPAGLFALSHTVTGGARSLPVAAPGEQDDPFAQERALLGNRDPSFDAARPDDGLDAGVVPGSTAGATQLLLKQLIDEVRGLRVESGAARAAASVQVDFKNVPKGTRVDSKGAAVTMKKGFTMGESY